MATIRNNIGKVPLYKGVYTQGTAYGKLNQVSYGGSTYQSKIDGNVSVPPNDTWDIIAMKGQDADVSGANTAITNANKKIEEMTTLQGQMETLKTETTTAKDGANTAAGLANNGATLANEKAGLANTAATNANAKIEEMSILGTQLGQVKDECIEATNNANVLINRVADLEKQPSIICAGVTPKENSFIQITQEQVNHINSSDVISIQTVVRGSSNVTDWYRYLVLFESSVLASDGNSYRYDGNLSFSLGHNGRVRINDSSAGGSDDFNYYINSYIFTLVVNRISGEVSVYERNNLIGKKVLERAKMSKFIGDAGIFKISCGARGNSFYDYVIYDCDIMELSQMADVKTALSCEYYSNYIKSITGATTVIGNFNSGDDLWKVNFEMNRILALYKSNDGDAKVTRDNSDGACHIKTTTINSGEICLSSAAPLNSLMNNQKACITEMEFEVIEGYISITRGTFFGNGTSEANKFFIINKDTGEILSDTSNIGVGRYIYRILYYNYAGYPYYYIINTAVTHIKITGLSRQYIGSVVHLKCDQIVDGKLIDPENNNRYELSFTDNGVYPTKTSWSPTTVELYARTVTDSAPQSNRKPRLICEEWVNQSTGDVYIGVNLTTFKKITQ